MQDITSGIMMAALDARRRFQLSYGDAAIIEAYPRAMVCTQVLSEVLSDGPDCDGVRATNPFAEKAEQPVSLSFARWTALTQARPAARLERDVVLEVAVRGGPPASGTDAGRVPYLG